MKRVGLWMIGIVLFITVGLLTVELGYAQEPTCTLKTLKGWYPFAQHSTVLPPAFGVTEPTPSTAAGIQLFNGDGTGTVIFTFRIGGTTVQENEVAPVSYTVNADCTGSLKVSDELSFGLFIAPNGESIAQLATAPESNEMGGISWRVSLRLN